MLLEYIKIIAAHLQVNWYKVLVRAYAHHVNFTVYNAIRKCYTVNVSINRYTFVFGIPVSLITHNLNVLIAKYVKDKT